MGFEDIVDPDDSFVVQGSQGLCFLAEGIHGCPVGVPGCVR